MKPTCIRLTPKSYCVTGFAGQIIAMEVQTKHGMAYLPRRLVRLFATFRDINRDGVLPVADASLLLKEKE